MSHAMDRFCIALSGDFRRPDGSPTYPSFDLSPLYDDRRIETVWVDPVSQVFAVLLTNRVHPTAANIKIRKFRPRFHDAVFELVDQN